MLAQAPGHSTWDLVKCIDQWRYLKIGKVKVKRTTAQALRLCTGRTARRGSKGIALPFHDHDMRSVWGSASHPGRSLPPGKTRYPLYKRLGGPQGRSGKVQKISPPPEFDPRTVYPVASRSTDWASRPTKIGKNITKYLPNSQICWYADMIGYKVIRGSDPDATVSCLVNC